MEKVKEAIKKYALANAIRFEGKANAGTIIGRIMKEFPEFREKPKELAKLVSEGIKEIEKFDLSLLTKKATMERLLQ